MKIRSIIVDDEPNNIENLEYILRQACPNVHIVETALDAETAIAAIRRHRPDVLFLDIQMPDKSGFDVLRSLDVIDFEVIFVTAHDQYGIEAVKFSALDYILKPVTIDDVTKAVDRAVTKMEAKEKNHNMENLLEYIKQDKRGSPKIALPTQREILYVKVNEIIRCEASDNYTMFFLEDRHSVLVCKTLREFSELLVPHDFLRTHQSHLVNTRYVRSYLKLDGGMLLMTDQSKVPISRQYREAVKDALNKML